MKSITEAYKSSRKYKCPYCEVRKPRAELISHVDKRHEDLIPEGYTADRTVFESINGKNYNTCMICKIKVYEWDEKHGRYKNLCNKKSCREQVRKNALERHIRVYNKPTLLGDPDWQSHMLSKRRISGEYTFTDGGKRGYTATYERKALEFLDKVLGYHSSEIESPGPVFYYTYNDKKHFYISDIYIIPANLVIEIKDGGSNPNTRNMPDYRGKQLAKESLFTETGKYNYLRLTDNQFDQVIAVLADIKYDMVEERPMKIHINEVGGLANGPVGGAIPNPNSNNSTYIIPCSMHNTFTDDEDEWEFIVQNDSFGESFVYKGSDNVFYTKPLSDIEGMYPYAFKYTGNSKDIIDEFIKRVSSGKAYKESTLGVFLKHEPMVLDEILCHEEFQLIDNPWRDMNEDYAYIEQSIFDEAMSKGDSINSMISFIKESMEGLR